MLLLEAKAAVHFLSICTLTDNQSFMDKETPGRVQRNKNTILY